MSKIALNTFILSICLFGFGEAIFNGMPSVQGEHPFYVFLEIDRNNSNKQGCGGVLAGDAFVITAAHCVDRLIDNIRLHFGVHQTKNTEEEGRKIVTVYRDNIKIHPCFSRREMRNDIAIIKLDAPVEHSRYIQSAHFSSNCLLDEFTDGVTAGCGYQSTHGQIAEYLQWSPMSTVSKDECIQVFPELRQNTGAFCVGNQDYRSLCEGDSGNPLVRDIDNALIGIATFISGDGCENGLPQAFTKVFSYQNWIADITGLDLPLCHLDELEDLNNEFDLYC